LCKGFEVTSTVCSDVIIFDFVLIEELLKVLIGDLLVVYLDQILPALYVGVVWHSLLQLAVTSKRLLHDWKETNFTDNRCSQFPLPSVDFKLLYLFPLLRWRLLNATVEIIYNKNLVKRKKLAYLRGQEGGGRECLYATVRFNSVSVLLQLKQSKEFTIQTRYNLH
jgi:hypothetical protein